MTNSSVPAAAWSWTIATGSDCPMDPEHVIQLAVRAAEAAEASEPGAGVDAMSNEALEAAAVELGVELLRAVDVGFDAEGELQATVSSNSDAIAAARFIGF